MIPAWSLEGVREDLSRRFERDGFKADAVMMVGLLLARPQSPLARTEIVPNLQYLHHRSGAHIHFFCAGYGAYWSLAQVPDAERVVTIGTTQWLYSDRLFNDFRAELESVTRWRYSGGVDLLLTNALWNADSKEAELDFRSALAMSLDQAISDGAIPDVARWFEQIIRFAETNDQDDPTWGFAVSAGVAAARSGLVEAILSLLPGTFGREAAKVPHFVITNLATEDG